MSINFDDFVSDMAKSGEFWMFSVCDDVVWMYVLKKLGDEFFPGYADTNENFGYVMPRDDRDPVYWMRKSMLPVEVVEKRFGVPVEKLKKAQVVVLRPFVKDVVEPTVGYYGTA